MITEFQPQSFDWGERPWIFAASNRRRVVYAREFFGAALVGVAVHVQSLPYV